VGRGNKNTTPNRKTWVKGVEKTSGRKNLIEHPNKNHPQWATFLVRHLSARRRGAKKTSVIKGEKKITSRSEKKS